MEYLIAGHQGAGGGGGEGMGNWTRRLLMATLLKSWIDLCVNYLPHIFKPIQAAYKKFKTE